MAGRTLAATGPASACARTSSPRLQAQQSAIESVFAAVEERLAALAGDAARFKRIFSIEPGETGKPVSRILAVDLLRINDPRRLGGGTSVFRFPFWTPESVQWLGDGSLLVVNDNNFPATGGRSGTARDPTEWIWLRLPAAGRE